MQCSFGHSECIRFSGDWRFGHSDCISFSGDWRFDLSECISFSGDWKFGHSDCISYSVVLAILSAFGSVETGDLAILIA